MKRFVALVLLALALSACTIRFDMGLEVNEDESGTFAVFIGLDEEMRAALEDAGGGSFTEEMTNDVPEGFTAEEYSEDGFEGVRITGDFSSLEELNTKLADASTQEEGSVGPGLVDSFQLTHEGDEFRFSADASGIGDTLSEGMSETGGEDMMSGLGASMMADMFEIRFHLTLPGDITEHNADSVDGNTLTWNLAMDDTRTTLEAVSSTAGGSSAFLIGGIAVVAAALIGGGLVLSRRKRKSAVDAVTSAPIDPIS